MNIQSISQVYFSPTGTTKKITNEIAQSIHPNCVEVADFTKLAARARAALTFNNELVILGTPVHYGRVPPEVINCFSTINAKKTLAVLVVVYGNRAHENALIELRDLAVRTGFIPIAAGAFIGEHSYSSVDHPIAHGRPDAEDMNKARSYGTQIQEKIRSIEHLGKAELVNVPGDPAYREKKDPKVLRGAPATNKELCIKCGKCAEACPTEAIHEDDLTKTDKQRCILCYACMKACPTGARVVRSIMLNSLTKALSHRCQIRREPEIYL